MNLDAALETYIAESRELLQDMEDALLGLEQAEHAQEALNTIFRAAHTIKGSAGLFGLDDIVDFTHEVESLLDRMRAGAIAVDAENTALLLECCDFIARMIEGLSAGVQGLDQEDRARAAALRARLSACSARPAEGGDGQMAPCAPAAVERLGGAEGVESDDWHLSLRFGPDCLRDGMDPLSFLRYLTTLGAIVRMTPVDDALPALAQMDPERCYLGFEVRFRSAADKQTIEDVFEFVRADSIIRIVPPRSRIADYIRLLEALPEEDLRIGELLVRCGSLTAAELEDALALQQDLRGRADDRPLGAIMAESGMSATPVIEAAADKQVQSRAGTSAEASSIRIDAAKLDQLINLVGELVIAGAGTALNAQASGDGALIESISGLTRLVEEVRDCALRLRMVQIGATFRRFQRVVRDVSRELGKDIRLVVTGAETELDKTVVEKIGDPLLHLVRNAIDHGIESAEARAAGGKPVTGEVRLNAYHDSGSIVIEVADDGAGLDRARILEKAIEKGLIGEGQALEDQEVYNLIFEPGFSTAGEVTNLSGRGVGMDVVKRNITALRGTVEVESAPDAGTTFRVRLPLTLAIIEGFLVGVQASSFVVPLDVVLECVELSTPRPGDGGRDYMDLRGEVLPLIRLRELFGLDGGAPKRENVVVVQCAGVKAGLVVDRLMGEFQTVIKPLGRLFAHVGGISGSTILGDGEVALILDAPGLVRQATAVDHRGARARTYG